MVRMGIASTTDTHHGGKVLGLVYKGMCLGVLMGGYNQRRGRLEPMRLAYTWRAFQRRGIGGGGARITSIARYGFRCES